MKVKNFNNIYFSQFWKIDMDSYHINSEPVEENFQFVATIAANILGVGFALSDDLIKQFNCMDKDTIISVYKDILEIISDNNYYWATLIKQSKVFYPWFPDEVMKKSDADLFANQMLHYITLWTYVPSDFEKKLPENLVYAWKNIVSIIRPWTEKDFHESMENLMKSSIAFSPVQLKNIETYLKEVDSEHKKLPSVELLTNHENKIILFALGINCWIEIKNVSDYFETATDVLRYVALISSNNDEYWIRYHMVYLRNWIEKHKFSRKERRLIMSLLDLSNANIGNDMLRHEKEWKFIANLIHPYDVAKFSNWKAYQYEHAIEWFNIILWNNEWKSPISKLFQENIDKWDIDWLIKLWNKFPWDFCTRLDKILCLLKENNFSEKENNDYIQKLANVIYENANKISTPLLLRLLWHFRARKQDINNCVFNPKWKIFITEKIQKALPENRCDQIIWVCEYAISVKSMNKEPMWSVYISESMADYRIPTDLRDINDSLHPLTFWSSIKATINWNIRRFFIWWTNNEENNKDYYDYWRIDNDLWCLFLDKDYKPVWATWRNTRYRDKKDWAFIFSWDIIDWWNINWNWVSEYIDCDLEKLKKQWIRYIVPNITCFTWQKFCDQTHAMFWVMERDSFDLWWIYEPKSVKQKFDLISNSTQNIPMVFDVDENRIIWIDRSMPSSMRINIAWSQLDTITESWALAKKAIESQIATLKDLISANAKSRWHIVENYKDADIIFCTEDEALEINKDLQDVEKSQKFVFPTDLAYFSSDLMAEPEKE